eukprot:s127_g47.t1
MPTTTEEYRKVMKVEMYAWLAMASRYKAKHWLHGLTADSFLKFVEFILGDRVYGIQIPGSDGTLQKLRPDWAIILAFEHKLRKEAMKLVLAGHTLSDALDSVTKNADERSGFQKGKGKGKGKSKASHQADPRLKGLNLAWRTPDGRELCFSWNTGECDGTCGRVHQCRVKGCYADHKAVEHKQKSGSWQFSGAAEPSTVAPPPDPQVGSSSQVPLVKVLYLFAGRRRHSDVAAFLRQAESSGKIRLILKEFDIERSPDNDLTNVSLWSEIFDTLKEGGWCVIVSPPCNTFSRARFQLILNSCGGGLENPPVIGKGLKRSTDSSTSSTSFDKRLKVSAGLKPSPQVVLDSDEEVNVESNVDTSNKSGESTLVETGEGDDEKFDMQACCNTGSPIQVEWGQSTRSFVDGFGLCSPTRWKPHQRGERRTPDMIGLADSTFKILADCVTKSIVDVRREAFKLVTGKFDKSPFSDTALGELRAKWCALLSDPKDAGIVDEGQPFFLRALSQWLKVFRDPDVHWLVDEPDSFATGVCVGVEKPLPRSPQIFPLKTKHRKLDDTEFAAIAENYPSAQISSGELEKKFREEEDLGRMYPSKLGVLKQEFGDKLRVASMAAISKPDGSVRPLHDATHSVMVNHEIRYQDKILCPGPAEIAATVREATETGEAPFCVSADIRAAHRLVKVRRCDWGFLCCRADSASDTVWVNKTGTFGVSSAPYWWAKLAALLGRFVGFLFHRRRPMQMIYVDDLRGVFTGPEKFLFLCVWILAFEMIGTPCGYHKFKGGFASEFVGFHIRYDMAEVGILKKRGDWLLEWLRKAEQQRYVVATRDFVEFLGRLGFVSQLLVWMKPHLSPLYAWSAAVSRSTVGRLPQTVILTLKYIGMQLQAETYMVSTARPKVSKGDRFRTDAKCADHYVVLAGWELDTRRWFPLRVTVVEAPFLFKWASKSAELLASLVALHVFGWLEESRDRKAMELALCGGTDNRANEALTLKRATTKWPLMAINMQMSAHLARARLALTLQWRPREENQEADDLTNEKFDGFDMDKRISILLNEMDLSILTALVEAHEAFERAKVSAKELAKGEGEPKGKKFDKSPW